MNTDVTDLLQLLDECTVRAERAEADLAAANERVVRATKIHVRDKDAHASQYERVEAEMAAAQQQLDQVRADLEPIIAKHERAAESASRTGDIAYAVPIRAFCQQLRKALDTPARPRPQHQEDR